MNSKCIKKHTFLVGVFLVITMVFFIHPASAIEFEVGGKPVTIMGYINQGVSYGIAGDEYDTKEGFQSGIFQGLLEVEYLPSHDVKFFGSVSANVDWAYRSEGQEWQDKGFDKSRDRLYSLDETHDFLKELHLTSSPGNWLFRLGKQIVCWGEADVFRLMDQINPLDQRRGMTDVEFETTIIPIWLVKAEYYIQPDSTWLQDLAFEFVFNPNVDFRGNESIVPGNDVAGIWAPNVRIPLGGPYPMDYAHLGSLDVTLEEPDFLDSDGHEYGFRIKSVIHDAIITLNYFYGLDNDPVTRASAAPPDMGISPYDGRMIIHPKFEGHYPLFRIAGFTLTRDFENLYISALGGVAPVLRLEGFYGFSNTFVTAGKSALEEFEEYNEIRWLIGIDWKVKINWLNPRAYFTIMPQFYHRKILDYPSNYTLMCSGGLPVEDDNYQTSLVINTTYFHNKLAPSFVWLRDITNKANFFKLQLSWEQSHHWNYTLGALFFDGDKEGLGFEPLANKDQIYFTVAYRF